MNEKGTIATSVNFPFGPKCDVNVITEYLRDNISVNCPEWRIDAYACTTFDSSFKTTNHYLTFKLYINDKA